MRAFVCLLLANSLLVGLCSAQEVAKAELFRQSFLSRSSRDTLLAVHRGDWRGYPENSILAIEGAIAMRAAIVEVDVGKTKDGKFILMHDDTVDRTTTGTGRVSDLTLAEIEGLFLKNGYGMHTPFRVPTLEAALDCVRGRILINLDKSYRFFREVMPLLERTGTSRQVIMKNNFNLPAEEILAENGDLLSKVIFMPLVNFQYPFAGKIGRELLERLNPPAMEIIYKDWRPDVAELYALCRKRGTRIWANVMWPELDGGVSDDLALSDMGSNYGRILSRGASVIQTDRPVLIRRYLDHALPAP